MKTIEEIIEGWAKNPTSVVKTNKKEYAVIARDYENHLINKLHYKTWFEFYDYAKYFIHPNASILDVCCGTGLVGKALSERNYRNIHGVDVNEAMTQIAISKNVYKSMYVHDMNQVLRVKPYDTTICIGSMTYFEPFGLLENMMDLTKPNGHIVFSHRTDMYDEQGYEDYLSNHPVVDVAMVSDDLLYLPGDPNYGTDIKVKVVVLQKC